MEGKGRKTVCKDMVNLYMKCDRRQLKLQTNAAFSITKLWGKKTLFSPFVTDVSMKVTKWLQTGTIRSQQLPYDADCSYAKKKNWHIPLVSTFSFAH